MDKVQIYVVCHKKADIYQDEVYTPIQVGFNHTVDLGFIKDNQGDNISKKNSIYSELTAHYWAWKNSQTEYIGICHYRRYFEKLFTKDNIDEEFEKGKVDFIVAQKIEYPTNLIENFSCQLVPEDIHIFYLYMLARFPTETNLLEKYFIQGNAMYPANMLLCKKELFDKYCEYQFSIFEDLESLLSFSEYPNSKRVIGYLGEMLLGYYIFKNNLKVKEYKAVTMIGSEIHWHKMDWKTKFRNWRQFKRKKHIFEFTLKSRQADL